VKKHLTPHIMRKTFRYIKIILFALTTLSIVSFLVGEDSPARFQYNHNAVLRRFADIISLCSIVFLASRQWKPRGIDKFFIISCLTYFSFTILDLSVWLWWARSSLYIYIIIIHSLPIPILLHQLLSGRQIKIKTYFITGLIICFLGFAYDIVFINIPYQDVTAELFEKSIIQEKIRNSLYYIGLIILSVGFIKTITSQKIVHRQPTSPENK